MSCSLLCRQVFLACVGRCHTHPVHHGEQHRLSDILQLPGSTGHGSRWQNQDPLKFIFLLHSAASQFMRLPIQRGYYTATSPPGPAQQRGWSSHLCKGRLCRNSGLGNAFPVAQRGQCPSLLRERGTEGGMAEGCQLPVPLGSWHPSLSPCELRGVGGTRLLSLLGGMYGPSPQIDFTILGDGELSEKTLGREDATN